MNPLPVQPCRTDALPGTSFPGVRPAVVAGFHVDADAGERTA